MTATTTWARIEGVMNLPATTRIDMNVRILSLILTTGTNATDERILFCYRVALKRARCVCVVCNL
jgi:hypothetical protein